ncbi:MAG: protein-L-isoaspartate O-methyltransferase family protein [Hydrogenovibrio sp.]
MNLEQARFNMVEQQIRPWDVLDPQILELFMTTPRHEFVTEAQQALAYSDIELPIGENQTMLPPRVEARLLQALDPSFNESALEIGTGSGYTTAILAKAVKHVTTVEIHPSLQSQAKERLKSFNNITFQQGDASQDWQDAQSYDVILITGAVTETPQAYKNKLNLGGRLAVIHGQKPVMTAEVYTRISESEWESETLFETCIPYLVHAEPKDTFAF